MAKSCQSVQDTFPFTLLSLEHRYNQLAHLNGGVASRYWKSVLLGSPVLSPLGLCRPESTHSISCCGIVFPGDASGRSLCSCKPGHGQRDPDQAPSGPRVIQQALRGPERD